MKNLIILEGPDGIGKSTVCAELSKQIPNSEVLAFPGNEPGTLGKWVYNMHHDPTLAIGPTALQALHIAAHIDAVERVIMPKLREGTTVILDRYLFSTWVYGRVYGAHLPTLKYLVDAEELFWYGQGIEEFNVIYVIIDVPKPYNDFERSMVTWNELNGQYRDLYKQLKFELSDWYKSRIHQVGDVTLDEKVNAILALVND